ncbi:unnamed protein product [[Candida] boidinii]|uniref:Unnamed protein product n=1 Tax=Candida boidinii TaxID=5477 RepID=A0A9W6WGD8_CANBO|nr:transferase activity, transferring phosphorus-containing groups protein [[Candida] boidinii]GME69974.1 unnamed protein product [[Candida] boidinii]
MERPRYSRNKSNSSIRTRRRSTSRRRSIITAAGANSGPLSVSALQLNTTTTTTTPSLTTAPPSSSSTSLRRRSSSSHSLSAGRLNIQDDSLYTLESNLNEVKAVLDNTLPIDYFKQDIITVLKLLNIPKWRKIKVNNNNLKLLKINRISGALTNSVYKLEYKTFYPLLLRVYGKNVDTFIDRKSELSTIIRLSSKNIGPKLLGCFSNGRFEEYLNNSITLNKDQIKDAKISRMIARRMKELHHGIKLLENEKFQGPKCWSTIEDWIEKIDEIIKSEKLNNEIDEKDEVNVFFLTWSNFKKLIFNYRNWLYSRYGGKINLDEKLKFCHNDTQYGNLLFYNKLDSSSLFEDDDEDDDDDEINELLDEHDMENSARSFSRNSITTSLYYNPSINIVDIDNFDLDDTTNPTPDNNNNKETDEIISKASNLSLNSTSVTKLTEDLSYKNDKKLVVIDFEYAGPNLPAYDITNHFCEWMANYHHPTQSYKINEDSYPTREERLNLLNTYVNYIPGSQTPRLFSSSNRSTSVINIKELELSQKVIELYNETIIWRASNSIFWALWGLLSKGSLKSTISPRLMQDSVEIGPNGEKYTIVVEDESDKSPSISSSPSTPSSDMDTTNSDEVMTTAPTTVPTTTTTTTTTGEVTKINSILSDTEVEEITEDNDDNFDHLGYCQEKCAIVIGDLIRFGLVDEKIIPSNLKDKIKWLDCEFLK